MSSPQDNSLNVMEQNKSVLGVTKFPLPSLLGRHKDFRLFRGPLPCTQDEVCVRYLTDANNSKEKPPGSIVITTVGQKKVLPCALHEMGCSVDPFLCMEG